MTSHYELDPDHAEILGIGPVVEASATTLMGLQLMLHEARKDASGYREGCLMSASVIEYDVVTHLDGIVELVEHVTEQVSKHVVAFIDEPTKR